jgi:hypothetical protein
LGISWNDLANTNGRHLSAEMFFGQPISPLDEDVLGLAGRLGRICNCLLAPWSTQSSLRTSGSDMAGDHQGSPYIAMWITSETTRTTKYKVAMIPSTLPAVAADRPPIVPAEASISRTTRRPLIQAIGPKRAQNALKIPITNTPTACRCRASRVARGLSGDPVTEAGYYQPVPYCGDSERLRRYNMIHPPNPCRKPDIM